VTADNNCGGMTIEIARKYAFRFGRAKDAPNIKHSVGQFGVGMKRALFKIGRQICIKSTTENSRFEMDINVDEWASQKEWEFRFKTVEENEKTYPEDEWGTTIIVTKLRESVSKEFASATTYKNLKLEIENKIQYPLSRGLNISVNNTSLDFDDLTFFDNPKLTPSHWKHSYKSKGKPSVDVSIYCGLGDSKVKVDAGWHVFCNGRLILRGDKSSKTGWGDKAGEISIPGFHGQYNMFRGYVFFDSDTPSQLPWDTKKTGVNEDSEVWKATKQELKRMALPVKNFLDALKQEKDRKDKADDDTSGPLQVLVDSSQQESIRNVKTRMLFELPKVEKAKQSQGPKMGKISFQKPLKEIEAAKGLLRAKNRTEIGEMVFDYFMEQEADDE